MYGSHPSVQRVYVLLNEWISSFLMSSFQDSRIRRASEAQEVIKYDYATITVRVEMMRINPTYDMEGKHDKKVGIKLIRCQPSIVLHV